MDKLSDIFDIPGGVGAGHGVAELMFALILCLLCQVIISLVYRKTYRGINYSASFVQTIVLMGLVTTVIMVVIGSNIARAFSLVGALSIIRFRNAVKATRDLGFIFFAMAIAMACGTRFYGVAVIATASISSAMILLDILDFGAMKDSGNRLLNVRMPAGSDPMERLRPTLDELFSEYSLITIENVRQGLQLELCLSVLPRTGVGPAQVIELLTKANNNLKVVYHSDAHRQEL